MKTETNLLNPNWKLRPSIEQQLRRARRTMSIWAKPIDAARAIETLEGSVHTKQGDYLCRGLAGEYWAQAGSKLREKYVASSKIDEDGWQRFDPNPNAPLVEAAQVNEPFEVQLNSGRLKGKAGDYVVRSLRNHGDVWIVAKAIFEASYVITPCGETRSQPDG